MRNNSFSKEFTHKIALQHISLNLLKGPETSICQVLLKINTYTLELDPRVVPRFCCGV